MKEGLPKAVENSGVESKGIKGFLGDIKELGRKGLLAIGTVVAFTALFSSDASAQTIEKEVRQYLPENPVLLKASEVQAIRTVASGDAFLDHLKKSGAKFTTEKTKSGVSAMKSGDVSYISLSEDHAILELHKDTSENSDNFMLAKLGEHHHVVSGKHGDTTEIFNATFDPHADGDGVLTFTHLVKIGDKLVSDVQITNPLNVELVEYTSLLSKIEADIAEREAKLSKSQSGVKK
ncbi:MAG: hypothetical protein V4439_00220 [Patescibacteria group bacterium]